jgi:hypothetical protein
VSPGKTFVGTLVVDDATQQPDFAMRFYASRGEDEPADNGPAADVAETVFELIAALPEHTVPSQRALFAHLRTAGHQIREGTVRDAVDDLLVTERPTDVAGKRRAIGYRAILTAAQESDA